MKVPASLPAVFSFLQVGSVRVIFAILSLTVIACACRTHRLAFRIPPDAPAVVFTDCRREHDSGFSELEQTLVAAARHYLERMEHRVIDAYYRVRHTFDGNEVIVMYVSSYDEHAQPVFGNYCVVLMREDGTIIGVFESTHSHVERFKRAGKKSRLMQLGGIAT